MQFVFCSLKRRPPHSTLGADVCEEVDQNLGGFWQNLGDSWQNLASENATAFATKQCQEIMKIHQKIGPKTQKSINMSKNEPRAEKVAPRIGKEAKKGQGGTRFGPLQGT